MSQQIERRAVGNVCVECDGVTVLNVESGVLEHVSGLSCILAVPAQTREQRRDALLEIIARQGERFIVTWGSQRDATDKCTLMAVKGGRWYALDYTCRGLVQPDHSYLGVGIETGVGSSPMVVAEEEGREAFFVALDPRTGEAVGPDAVVRERFSVKLRASPLVFEMRRDRRDASTLVAVLLGGSVTRVHRTGHVNKSRGPFAVDGAQVSLVQEGDRLVGVPGNERFTHVVFDMSSAEQAQALLALPASELAARVLSWDAARVDVVDRASARLAARSAAEA